MGLEKIKRQLNSELLHRNEDRFFEQDKRTFKGKFGYKTEENTFISPHVYRMVISLRGLPLHFNDYIENDPSIRLTSGLYSIIYWPPGCKQRIDTRPFTVWTDLVGFRLNVSGPAQLHVLAKYLPEINWMISNNNTNYGDGLFRIAQAHAGVPIPFSINMISYYSKLYDYARKHKENLKEGLMLAHLCKDEEYEKVYKYKTVFPPMTKEEFLKIEKIIKKEEADYGK